MLAAAVAVAAMATGCRQQAVVDDGIGIVVTLSPRAAEEMESRDEQITVSAAWYGAPRPDAVGDVDETGRLALGTRQWLLPGQGGSVDVAPDDRTRGNYPRVEGPVGVNVNIYSARKSGPDNLLACDIIDGDIASLAGREVAIACSLIEEGTPTRHFP